MASTLILLGILAKARSELGRPRQDEATSELGHLMCPGNRQLVEVPIDYDMEVPENIDGDTNNITKVHLMFDITQLKTVQEDMYVGFFQVICRAIC